MDKTNESTRGKVLRSTLWATNSKILSQIMGFVTTLIMARLLSLEDFGQMAMALIFMGLVDTFIDLGFLSAIIQAKEIHRRQLSSCFWLLLALSLAVTLVSLAGAPLIARAFDVDGVTKLVRCLAPLFLLAPLNIVCKGILSRDLRLDVLAKIEMYAGVSKMGLSILLAAIGCGVFSLVFGFVLERILLTIWVAFAAKWYPRFEYERESVGHFLSFGSKITASSLLWYLYTKADVFVIGRVLGVEILGVYTIASQFPQTIVRLVPSTWHRILCPLFARYQESPELKQIVTRSSSLLLLVSLPLFVGLAAISSDVIDVLFGARWHEAIFPMQMLSVVGAIETVTWTLVAALTAIGRPGINTLINLLAAIVFPAMFYIGAQHWGVEGVLWASIMVYLYRFIAFLLLTSRFLELRLWSYAKEHLGSIAAALIMFIGVVALNRGGADWNIYLRMTSCIVFGAASYLAVLYIVSRRQIDLILSYVRPV